MRYTETGQEFWLARELMELLGYTRWQNLIKVIEKAQEASKNAGQAVENHFTEVSKMVDLCSGSQREIADIALTRYACYLIVQNGDSRKEPIAFAQTYFAVQTRKQELVAKGIADRERLHARRKLTESEKSLSELIVTRVPDERAVARIRSKGDAALFGGVSTAEMKRQLDIPASRALADFLPTITSKAKDLATEITTFKIVEHDLQAEAPISQEHVHSNESVRHALTERGIAQEALPAAEATQKVERRVLSEERQLPALRAPKRSKRR